MKTTFVNLRIFSHPWKGESQKEHSYYVGHDSGGLSERLDALAVDSEGSWLKLREHLEEQLDGNIMRRRPFYTELLSFMQRCPNPLGYEGDALELYRFAILKMKDDKNFVPSVKDITLIPEDAEASPICNIVDDELLGTDIVLIPKTQIHPATDRLSDHL